LSTANDSSSKNMKSHPFNICTDRPNRDPHFGAGKLGMLARKNQDNLKSKRKVWYCCRGKIIDSTLEECERGDKTERTQLGDRYDGVAVSYL
jgi:hypothetical protein